MTSLENEARIAIICEEDPRPTVISKAAVEAGIGEIFWWRNGTIEKWVGEEDAWIPVSASQAETYRVCRNVDLVFVHSGQRWEISKYRPSGASAKRRVWFGTGDTRAWKKERRCGSPPFSKEDSQCPITSRDFQDLLSWARGDLDAPPLMDALAAPEHLVSLLILCQGYLAVHAIPETGEFEGTDRMGVVDCALQRMGWRDFLRSDAAGQLLSGGLRDVRKRKLYQDSVSSLSWWRIFDEDNLEAALRREWSTNESDGEKVDDWVLELALRIRGKKGPKALSSRDDVDAPSVVAHAYLAIAEKLQ
ncbi:MAG: hypothetical protein GY854_19370 [Deltaproteobacteria bacterium]|nr:hypothetical protein [Deltaproteobacteria bacterium]